MSVCAITMVYRDYWALAQWYAHYGHRLGPRNLFVVSHGHDQKVQEICPEASVITIPRTSLAHFDRQRGLLLNRLQNALNVAFDWVIRTDSDELICLDPSRFESFEAFFAEQTADAIFALGLNLAETGADRQLDDSDRVLAHRRHAVFTGQFSKAWAVRNRISLVQHGIKVRPGQAETFPFVMPEGVFLAHLKFANLTALNEANKHRREVGNAPGRGRPGTAWKQPGSEARRFFARFDELEDLPWEQALAQARAQIAQDPHRDKRLGLIRARNPRQRAKTTLPDWFGRI